MLYDDKRAIRGGVTPIGMPVSGNALSADYAVTIRFWGVRGSYPVSGRDHLRYGGHTSCVEIRLGHRLFVIDAGSGLIGLGESLMAESPRRIDLLFSHLHHDHIAAFPFFAPAMSKDCAIHTYCGHLDGRSAEAPLNTMFAPPLFPIALSVLSAPIEHHGFAAGETLSIQGAEIATCPLSHPGGATAYRFDHGGRRICYVSDLEHRADRPEPDLVRFCQGADVVIYDSMYAASEYPAFKGWGHSTWEAGVALCRAAGAKALAGFHHNPFHTDRDLAALEAELKAVSPRSFFAREGQVVAFAPVRASAELLR